MPVRRPVTRLWSASSNSFRSVVGAWMISAKPLKATMPMWASADWPSMNVAAASSAASSRFGAMSAAHMLRDTSMARMIVVWLDGTAAVTAGRATATSRHAIASAKKAKGRCRRSRERGGSAALMSDTLE